MLANVDGLVGQRLAEQVVHEADRLAAIVDGLLELTAIESGDAKRLTAVLGSLVTAAADRVRAAAELTEIDLQLDSLEPQFRIECNPQQVVSAITNLLGNAIAYSEPGGTVEIGTTADDTYVT